MTIATLHSRAPHAEQATQVSAAEQPQCTAAHQQSIAIRFEAASAWNFCWDIDIETGLTISGLQHTTPRGTIVDVLRSAALAQINVPYDNGKYEQSDLPGFGFLTSRLRPEDCSGGTRFSTPEYPDALCAVVEHEPLRYEWSDYDFDTGNHAAPGECLLIYSVAPASWYTYATKWRMCDDGTITPTVDAGGTLAPHYHGNSKDGVAVGPGQTTFAMSHFHNVFWRLEFDLGGSRILQIDDLVSGSRHDVTAQKLTREIALDRADNRSWRVESSTLLNSDQHPVSYDIHLASSARYHNPKGHEYTAHDIFISQQRSCERLASDNKHLPCAETVDRYLNGEKLAEPVLWVQVSFHHLPRDEDQPIMNQHSQGFTVTPRALTAENELVRK